MNLDAILLDIWEAVIVIFNFWRSLTVSVGGVQINVFTLILTFGIVEFLVPLLLRESQKEDGDDE